MGCAVGGPFENADVQNARALEPPVSAEKERNCRNSSVFLKNKRKRGNFDDVHCYNSKFITAAFMIIPFRIPGVLT